MYKGQPILNESKIVEPYSKDAPIVLKTLNCKASYDDSNHTITIEVPNKDSFVCSANSFFVNLRLTL